MPKYRDFDTKRMVARRTMTRMERRGRITLARWDYPDGQTLGGQWPEVPPATQKDPVRGSQAKACRAEVIVALGSVGRGRLYKRLPVAVDPLVLSDYRPERGCNSRLLCLGVQQVAPQTSAPHSSVNTGSVSGTSSGGAANAPASASLSKALSHSKGYPTGTRAPVLSVCGYGCDEINHTAGV